MTRLCPGPRLHKVSYVVQASGLAGSGLFQVTLSLLVSTRAPTVTE